MQEVPAGEKPVPMFVNDSGPWGGLTALGEDDERKPQWVPYVPVADLSAAADRAASLGASVVRGPIELPAGSLMVIADPSGAPIVLWQASGA